MELWSDGVMEWWSCGEDIGMILIDIFTTPQLHNFTPSKLHNSTTL
jgi:hypothetical protein